MSGIKANEIAEQTALVFIGGGIRNPGEFLWALQEFGVDPIHEPDMRSVVLNRILPLVAEKKRKMKAQLLGTTALTPFRPQT